MNQVTGWGLSLLGASVLLFGGCADGPHDNPLAPAELEFAVTQEFDDRGGDVFWNECAGEYVGFASGSVDHLVTQSRSDGNGGYHVRIHRNGQHYHGPGLNWTGSAWEPTGTQYVGTNVVNYSLNVRPPFPAEYTRVHRVRLIQKGPGPDSFFNIVDHITVNAEGVVTADVFDVFISCK